MVYLAYLVARLLAQHLPLRLAGWLAGRVGDVWYAASPRLRSNLDRNLALVPALSGSPGLRRRVARRNVRNFAGVVAEFLRLPAMKPGDLERLVNLEGFKQLAAAAGGRPVVLVTGHLGNWELGAAAAAAVGIKLHIVVYDHPDPRVASLFRKTREAMGLKVMSLGEAARALGGLIASVPVGLAGDRDFTGRGTEANLFGTAVRVPSAYAALAFGEGVPMVSGFCVRLADGRYGLKSEWIAGTPSGGAPDAAEAVRRYLRTVEKCVEECPDQWYRFEYIGK